MAVYMCVLRLFQPVSFFINGTFNLCFSFCQFSLCSASHIIWLYAASSLSLSHTYIHTMNCDKCHVCALNISMELKCQLMDMVQVFRYNDVEDRLELCLEPHGHFPVQPEIEKLVRSGMIPHDVHSSVSDEAGVWNFTVKCFKQSCLKCAVSTWERFRKGMLSRVADKFIKKIGLFLATWISLLK